VRWLWRWAKRSILLLVVVALGLAAPVGYVEVMCRGEAVADRYVPLLPVAERRGEARTLLTYPEWHIVHAYADYAAVIAVGDPHEFGFLQAISGFWGSLCAVSKQAGAHGGVDWPTKQMVYTIGVSFTAELLAKAAYEETLGRAAVWIRGAERAPLDDLSARQAADYASFLRQVPWYRWDFAADNTALQTAATSAFRDTERALALGLEYRVKAAYARAIGAAVAGMAPDALRMRVIVTGIAPEVLATLPDVTVIGERPEGVEIETPRYAAFTDLAKVLAAGGAGFVEIAGNDEIMFTMISEQPTVPGGLYSLPRQGNAGYRHLVLIPLADLGARIRGLGDALEHIHDY
jgi:hypothetical protein